MNNNTAKAALAKLDEITLADVNALDDKTLHRLREACSNWLQLADAEVARRQVTR